MFFLFNKDYVKRKFSLLLLLLLRLVTKKLLLIASNASSSSFLHFQACPIADSSAVQFAPSVTDSSPISNHPALLLIV
jgi:hypothetical protein